METLHKKGAGYELNLNGQMASIRNPGTGKEIISAQVIEHIKRTHTIRVHDYNNKDLRAIVNVNVVFRIAGSVATFKGTVRKSTGSNSVEISLYGENMTGERKQKRYDVEGYGDLEALKFDGQIVELRKPLPVMISNISSGGCLLRSSPSTFDKDAEFRLTFDFSGEQATIMCKIARKSVRTAAYAEYGCEFIERIK